MPWTASWLPWPSPTTAPGTGPTSTLRPHHAASPFSPNTHLDVSLSSLFSLHPVRFLLSLLNPAGSFWLSCPFLLICGCLCFTDSGATESESPAVAGCVRGPSALLPGHLRVGPAPDGPLRHQLRIRGPDR